MSRRSQLRFFSRFILPAAATTVLALVWLAGSVPAGAPEGSIDLSRLRDHGGARLLGELERSMPGDAGMSPDGPASAAEEAFAARAYPDTDMPLERIEAARAAFAAVKGRGVGRGKNSTTSWYSLGPTSAVYQETQYRWFSYVPSRYLASGRVTAMAIGRTCTPARCRIFVAAAGGGIWRADNALVAEPKWTYLGEALGINAVGSIEIDPKDPSDNTVWVGTGEANASGDSAAGVGIYKSTDGGATWQGPLGEAWLKGRSAGSIALHPTDPDVIYVATTRGVAGVSSVTGGVTSNIPGASPYGLYKSVDGGSTFTFLHNGTVSAATCYPIIGAACSLRGVRRVALDPSDPNIVYAGSYGRGVWRSNDAGATWVQIKPSLNSALNTMRPEIAVTRLPDGKTRMYVGEGSAGETISSVRYYSRLYRSDDVATGTPVFVDLTSSDPADTGYGSYNYCTGQCWYDNLVVTPPGFPDIVYLGGSFLYNETSRISNARGVVMSTDAGASFTDMTEDTASKWAPNGIHPDQHALVVNPNNPYQFFEGGDGGVVRSDGNLEDASSRCADRGLSDVAYGRCVQLLSRVPRRIDSLNKGLSTLQFYSLSVSPHNPNIVQGGTQDNGTFETSGSSAVWLQTFWGDGGQSGFDAADPLFRFHTFFNASPDVNFTGGALHDWNWIADQIYFSGEPQAFYVPIISDPVVTRSMFAGLSHVWRTKTHGMGERSTNAFRAACNEFTGTFDDFCGDWEPLGATSYVKQPFPFLPSSGSYAATRLTASGALYGTDRSGGTVAAVERAPGNTSTLWAATSAGRVFVSHNADTDPASAVVFARIDPMSSVDPNRFVSSIHVDPGNPNRAWLSYSGFSAVTPATPGHVFEVVYDPNTNTATWTSLDYDLGDLAVTDLVRDDQTGDLYAASDFGVAKLAAGTTTWMLAANGMPRVEVSGLTIATKARRLYAATHGLGAWSLVLP